MSHEPCPTNVTPHGMVYHTVCGYMGSCRCMWCARCDQVTGDTNQGHYWAFCKATGTRREFHFCCPDNCELETRIKDLRTLIDSPSSTEEDEDEGYYRMKSDHRAIQYFTARIIPRDEFNEKWERVTVGPYVNILKKGK